MFCYSLEGKMTCVQVYRRYKCINEFQNHCWWVGEYEFEGRCPLVYTCKWFTRTEINWPIINALLFARPTKVWNIMMICLSPRMVVFIWYMQAMRTHDSKSPNHECIVCSRTVKYHDAISLMRHVMNHTIYALKRM